MPVKIDADKITEAVADLRIDASGGMYQAVLETTTHEALLRGDCVYEMPETLEDFARILADAHYVGHRVSLDNLERTLGWLQ